MEGNFDRTLFYPNVWAEAKASTEHHIGKVVRLTEFKNDLGGYQVGLIKDMLTIQHKEDHLGYILFNESNVPKTLKEVGFFRNGIQYKFDENTVSELVLEQPFANPKYPFFEYIWSNTKHYDDQNLQSLKFTIRPKISGTYHIDNNFELEMLEGLSTMGLPKSIRGAEHLQIKREGKKTQHQIRWYAITELKKMATYDGSKFEEAVDILYPKGKEPIKERDESLIEKINKELYGK